jgi:hypothetical protein
MCNPSPQGRCRADAMKMARGKISHYESVANDFYSKTEAEHIAESGKAGYESKLEKVREVIDEVDKAKAFLYATPNAQKDPSFVANQLQEAQKGLSPRARLALNLNDNENRRAGKILGNLQSRVRDYAKENPEKSNLEVARYAVKSAFINSRGKMNMELTNSYRTSLAEELRNAPTKDHGKIKAQRAAEHRANVAVLDKAYSYATEDAKDTIDKDIKKNSATFSNSIDKHKFGFYKREDGSFTIRTRFEVKGKDFGSALEQAEDSFNLEDVQITMSKPVDGVYTVDTAYIYRGGESIEDAKKFQQKAWKGTPQWRETLRQTKMLEDFYDKDNQQGKYSVI